MKKIININFHSRVIPIEETAYDILRKYVDSLKKHFAGEEGGDEIVNDIENRFAELFSDRLKKGATCITDADVDEIITSMGRPEDFDQEEASTTNNSTTGAKQSYSHSQETATEEPRRLNRSENDKMLGGVCGGIAAYLKIDSSIVRILFALLTLGFGTGILVYLILWVVLPTKTMVTNIRKRLFRDTDHKVVGGVAGGLAEYFNIEVWIPRLIFCLPLILGILRSLFRHAWFDVGSTFSFLANGFGGGLTTLYIILWIVLPEAKTASEKLEMRGEKIDLESIKNTIKGDLEGFRQKATVVGSEIKQKAEEFSSEVKNRSGSFRKEIASVNGPARGIGHAIGVLFKAFFLFISVIVAFALVTALFALIFTGAGVLPLKNYFIQGFWQNVLAWCVLVLFLILPVVGLLTWLIRRIIGARKGSSYLGYTFGGLWTIGLICLIFLAAQVSSAFRTRNGVKEDIVFNAPSTGKLIVKMDDARPLFTDTDDWMGVDWHHKGPFIEISDDSVSMNTVGINVVMSKDSAWHISSQKMSRGYNLSEARSTADQIVFPVQQNDSILILPRGFTIKPSQRFHNQQVLVVIEMPVGKRILMSKSLDNYHWFNVKGNYTNVNVSEDYDNEEASSWDTEVEYIMTRDGLERTGKSNSTDADDDDEDNGNRKSVPSDSTRKKEDNPKGEYRYHKSKTAEIILQKESGSGNTIENGDLKSGATLLLLTSLS